MTDLLLKPSTSGEGIAQTTTRQVEKSADRELNVELLLPNDWMKYEPYGPQPPDAAGLILFGRYGSRDGKAMIELRAQPILREVASADWFEHFARVGRFVVEKIRRTSSPSGASIDAIATRAGKSGAPFVYRMSTYKDGGTIYLVSGFAHPQDFDRFQEAFVVAINSFRLTMPVDDPSAEPLRTVRLERVFPVQFVISQMWQRMQDPRTDIDLVHFENRGGDTLLGKLAVLVAPVTTFASSAAAIAAVVPSQAFALRPGAPAALGKGFTSAEQGDIRTPSGAGTESIRVFVARMGPVWVAVARWSILPSFEPYPIDAINDRAYDIVLRTFMAV